MLGGICSKVTNSYRPRTPARKPFSDEIRRFDGRGWRHRTSLASSSRELASFRRVSAELPLRSLELASSTPSRGCEIEVCSRRPGRCPSGLRADSPDLRCDCRRVDHRKVSQLSKFQTTSHVLIVARPSPQLISGKLVVARRAKESSMQKGTKSLFLIDTRRNRTLHSSVGRMLLSDLKRPRR
jgi:hypothetical protein